MTKTMTRTSTATRAAAHETLMRAPKTLNGYPVIAAVPRPNSRDGALLVMVYRPDYRGFNAYVVATWDPSLGDSWCWGHYFSTIFGATDYLNNRAEGGSP